MVLKSALSESLGTASADTYHRFVYWLKEQAHTYLLQTLKDQGKQVHLARNQPCEALYPRRHIVSVAPGVWNRRCIRQGSWYRNSRLQGLYLLVSNDLLEDLVPWTRISIHAFQPLRLAGASHVIDLVSDPRICQQLPPGWGLFTQWELQSIQYFLQSEKITMSIQELFLYYTANHANFLCPRFFLEEDSEIIPYSIQVSALVCSACVELFGIIGQEFSKKYVAPCPGLKYVRLLQGSYFLVER